MEKQKFIIKRSKWGRAKLGECHDGMLYNKETKKMCCLGFWCSQIGRVSLEEMEGLGEPSELRSIEAEEMISTKAIQRLIVLNDRHAFEVFNLSSEEQERQIAEEFAREGFEVVFKD